MDEQQVRLLVRQAIARHMGVPATASAPQPAPAAAAAAAPVPSPAPIGAASLTFTQFQLVRPAGETECLIEPTVTCNHCGHCQCFGH